MHIRTATSLAALLLGATLTMPAMAMGTIISNPGPAGGSAGAATPVTLPDSLAGAPLLAVDGATATRAMPDLDAAVGSMGTLTRNPDGSVTQMPASAAMRGLVEASVAGSNTGQSAGTVVGADGRTQITDGKSFPAAVVGWLWTEDQKGVWTSCTATLIGPQTILTAAHCVYKHEAGGFVGQGQFYPGVTDGVNAPFGRFEITYINVLSGYVDGFDGKNYGTSMPWDLAEVELAADAGNQIGWLGWGPDKSLAFDATMIGYPADKPKGTLWQDKCHVDDANFGDTVFWHDCDSAQGASGAALFTLDASGNTVIHGINVAEDDTRNYAVRLSGPIAQFLSEHYK
ncbi:MAG: trypsin-like peptidase domain-containing protein [Devosia sp.]